MLFIIIGAVLLGVAAMLALFRSKKNDQLLEIRSTKQSRIADICDTHKAVFDGVGAGGFSQLSEVSGTVESDAPLTSDLAEVPCVWYESRIEERYEENYTETDSQGNTVRRTRTASETIQRNEGSQRFLLRDASGTILIDPKDAKVEPEVVLERHEPYDGRDDLKIGPFTIRPTTGRRILGYDYHERALPIGSRLYVIGDASDRNDGTLCIRKPTDKTKPFIVSTRSEEEVVESMQKAAKVKMVIGFVLAVLGGASVVYGIVQ